MHVIEYYNNNYLVAKYNTNTGRLRVLTTKRSMHEKTKKLKICSVCWSFAAYASGILVPIIIALSTIYGIPNNNNYY